MRFSQRIGLVSIKDQLQVNSIDNRLKNQLWNEIYNIFDQLDDSRSREDASPRQTICKYLWVDFYGKQIDEIPCYMGTRITACESVVDYIKEWFFSSRWYEIYDLIEFLVELDNVLKFNIAIGFNNVLKKEMAGYRIIDNKVIQVTAEEEVVEIEAAIENTSVWQPVNKHLTASIQLFSNRDNPDYRNSIKESISAVESLCKILTGDKNAILGKALAKVERQFQIHAALRSAFSALYGYTSDSGGIRHAMLEDDIAVTMEDAKFMLVSCSAFINYIKAKIGSVNRMED